MSYNASENGNGMVMPVAPMGGYGYGGNGGFGNGFACFIRALHCSLFVKE